MEFCPKCRTIKNMNSSDLKRTVIDKDNKVTEIIIRSYCCVACGMLVRSENIDITNKKINATAFIDVTK